MPGKSWFRSRRVGKLVGSALWTGAIALAFTLPGQQIALARPVGPCEDNSGEPINLSSVFAVGNPDGLSFFPLSPDPCAAVFPKEPRAQREIASLCQSGSG